MLFNFLSENEKWNKKEANEEKKNYQNLCNGREGSVREGNGGGGRGDGKIIGEYKRSSRGKNGRWGILEKKRGERKGGGSRKELIFLILILLSIVEKLSNKRRNKRENLTRHFMVYVWVALRGIIGLQTLKSDQN